MKGETRDATEASLEASGTPFQKSWTNDILCYPHFFAMQLTLEDDLVSAARLTEGQARLTLALNLFAEDRLTLAQAARLAGLNRLAFQGELAARQIASHVGAEEFASDGESIGERRREGPGISDKPWMALRGSACFLGDPFAPVVSEEEILVLQKAETGVGS